MPSPLARLVLSKVEAKRRAQAARDGARLAELDAKRRGAEMEAEARQKFSESCREKLSAPNYKVEVKEAGEGGRREVVVTAELPGVESAAEANIE
eukprot:339845-Prorocentrum_minimum.AAC.1